MKNKMIALCMTLLILTLSACGNNEPMDDPSAASSDAPKVTASLTGQNPSDTAPGTVHPLENADFAGKISSCIYAGENKVLVVADELNLYDVQSGQTVATAPISTQTVVAHSFAGGYLIVGMGDSGMMGCLYDETLSNGREIVFGDLLKEDFVTSEQCVAISDDGGTIVISGLNGLYLYNVSSATLTKLITYGEDSKVNSMQISTIESLAFTGANELAYLGIGNSFPIRDGETGFSIYGTINMDGTLSITKNASYKASELFVGKDVIVMPQSFDQNNGTLLIADKASRKERTYSFSTSDEGKDGVFCSDNGDYFATAVLGNDLTIRIYDAHTGELCHTEAISDPDDTYFIRVPQVLMLDHTKTCIVLLGRGINEVDTLISTFGY